MSDIFSFIAVSFCIKKMEWKNKIICDKQSISLGNLELLIWLHLFHRIVRTQCRNGRQRDNQSTQQIRLKMF